MLVALKRAAAAAGAAVLVSAAAGSAQAAVIYSGTVNLPVPNTIDGLFLNVVTGSTFTGPGFPTLGGPGSNYDINPFGTTSWSFFSPGSSGQSAPTPVPTSQKGYVASSTSGPVSNLPQGTLIDGSSILNTGTPSGSAVATGSPAIVGFRFRNENDTSTPNDDTVHFGWARFNLSAGAPGTLIDYAWESTPNVGILAGVAVPEPASLGVLGLGGAMLVQRRRRRSA
jgi:hypothetical protein